MVTINDVWKHISNKIANKVNDPFEDLFATIVPIDSDGNFCKEISSFCEEYEGDSYIMLRKLTHNTNLLPSGAFAYFCPAKITLVKTHEELEEHRRKLAAGDDTRRKVLMISLVHPITLDEATGRPSDVVMDNGIYWLDTNTFEEMPSTVNGNAGGEGDGGDLPIALGGLALKWALDNGMLGELGMRLIKAISLAEQSLAEVESVVDSITDSAD